MSDINETNEIMETCPPSPGILNAFLLAPAPAPASQDVISSIGEGEAEGRDNSLLPSSTSEDNPNKTEQKEWASKILDKPAIKAAKEAQKQRVSRRLLLAERATKQTIVCDKTGAVILADIPALAGFALVYDSPFSHLPNARGMADKGSDYLRKQETQILAAICITLGEAYDLYKFQPTDSGAQKNAILRTAGKDILIDLAITIERFVHSGNCKYLPKLSLVFDDAIGENEYKVRIHNWLKVLIEAIYRPDREELETASNAVSVSKTSIAKKAQREALKIWKDSNPSIKASISLLYRDKVISDKLYNFLRMIIEGSNIITADPALVALLCTKLEGLSNNVADTIAASIRETFKKISEDNPFQDDPFAESFSSMPVGSTLATPEDSEDEEESDTAEAIEADIRENKLAKMEEELEALELSLEEANSTIERIKIKAKIAAISNRMKEI